MKSKVSLALAVIFVAAAVITSTTVALAGHEWIFLHHVDQGQGQESFDQCMPIESWNGHEDHEGDYYEGPYDNEGCEENEEPNDTPVVEPSATPTVEPSPTPTSTPTDEPELTPTPTEEGCGECDPPPSPTPTEILPPPTEVIPEETPQLPSAGFTSQYEIYALCEPWRLDVAGNVWAGHNDSSCEASEWWTYWQGKEFLFNGVWYTAVEYWIVDPTEVWLLGRATEFSLMLITCRGYSEETNSWSERLVIFANLSEGG
jgi:hypothetical protein